MVLLVRLSRSTAFSPTQARPPRWPSGKAAACGAAELSLIPVFPLWTFSELSHALSDFKCSTPVATLPGRLVLRGQHWDWLARCQNTVTG